MIKITLSILLICLVTVTHAQKSSISMFFGPKVHQKLKFKNPKIVENFITPRNAISFEVGVGFSRSIAKKTSVFSALSFGQLTNSTSILSDGTSTKGASIDEVSNYMNLIIGASYVLIGNKNKLSSSFGFGMRKVFETSAGGFVRQTYLPNQSEIIEYYQLPYLEGNYNSPMEYNPKLIPLIDLGLSYKIYISKRSDFLLNSIYNLTLKDNYKAVYQLKYNNNIIDNGELGNKNGGFLFQIGYAYKIQ